MLESEKEDDIINQVKYDKKYSAEMELILLTKIGELYKKEGKIGYKVDENLIRKVCQKYFKLRMKI